MRLDLSKKSEWYTLIPAAGIRVLAAPATTSIMDAARQDPRLLALRPEGTDDLDLDAEELDLDAATTSQLSRVLALIVAEQVIEDWEGVEDAKGGKAPVDADYIAAFLEHPAAADAWLEKYLTRWLSAGEAVTSEKKDSARSRTGTTGAARNTAKRAPRSAKPAPAKKTRRKA